jgi:GNAT superfamily N-acetyltransferase
MTTESAVHLRAVEPSDGQTLIRLVNAMADADKYPRLDLEAQQRLVRDALQKKRFDLVFAEWQHIVVGYAAFFEGYSTFEARSTLYIEDLFVMPEYRGRHVAFELFQHLLREAKRRDCGRVEWRFIEGNEDAVGFYDRLHAKRLQGWVHYRLNYDDIQRLA